jgi:hypothetical protein
MRFTPDRRADFSRNSVPLQAQRLKRNGFVCVADEITRVRWSKRDFLAKHYVYFRFDFDCNSIYVQARLQDEAQ